MLAFAKFAMHSPSRVFFLAGVGSFLPLLSFLSHALVALVWLRMGPSLGLRVALVASLGGIFSWYQGAGPVELFSLAGLVLLAEILRAKTSWARVLLAGVGIAGFVSLSYTWLPADTLAQLINLIVEHQGWEETYQLTSEQLNELQAALASLLNGVITSLQLLSLVLALALARYWQAGLYNPGGFGEEFRSLRLPPVAGLLPLAALGLVLSMQFKLLALAPVLLAAHLVTGLAVIHAWFKRKNHNAFWLGLVYVLLVTAQPYFSFLLILLALADSWRKPANQLASEASEPPNKHEED